MNATETRGETRSAIDLLSGPVRLAPAKAMTAAVVAVVIFAVGSGLLTPRGPITASEAIVSLVVALDAHFDRPGAFAAFMRDVVLQPAP